MNRFFKLRIFLFSLGLILLPSCVVAAEDPDIQELYKLFGELYTHFLLPVGTVVAGIVIMFGGIVYSTSGGEPEKAKKGREYIFGAISGLVLLIFASLIVKNLR